MIVYGRDRNYRPIIYIYPNRLIQSEAFKRGIKSITMPCVWIMEHIIHYMLLPRQIENWTTIVDLEKMPIKKIPRKVYIHIYIYIATKNGNTTFNKSLQSKTC